MFVLCFFAGVSTALNMASNAIRPSVIVSATPIAVTYDAGWQMRGNGKSYNSQSGRT